MAVPHSDSAAAATPAKSTLPRPSLSSSRSGIPSFRPPPPVATTPGTPTATAGRPRRSLVQEGQQQRTPLTPGTPVHAAHTSSSSTSASASGSRSPRTPLSVPMPKLHTTTPSASSSTTSAQSPVTPRRRLISTSRGTNGKATGVPAVPPIPRTPAAAAQHAAASNTPVSRTRAQHGPARARQPSPELLWGESAGRAPRRTDSPLSPVSTVPSPVDTVPLERATPPPAPAPVPPAPAPVPAASAPAPAAPPAANGKSSPVSSTEVTRLTARVAELETQYTILQAEHARCSPRSEANGPPARPPRRLEGVDGKVLALLNDRDVLGDAVRALLMAQRMNLLLVIAEALRPSDIQAQIEVLERLKLSRTGVLGRLDDELCTHVIQFLDRRDLLQLRLVSKRFDRLATSPSVWRRQCRDLEARWDGTIDLRNYNVPEDGDWLALFKSLWQREKHWTNGQAQSVAMLSGHTNYVTSLKLCGKTLISGSYDDTIRIWNIPHIISNPKAVPPPTVISAKSVSSIDYYEAEQVLVTGSHDIGRATIWRQLDGEWKQDKILSGHLHGTRGVAINAQWCVSVGSDKAIVVWDWRTGNKIVRFGQQTNVNIGMDLLDNYIITATVDGVIRSFSIGKREMLGQFRLSDLAARQPEFAARLKDVGVGALGMLTWFAAEGRFMACATKDIVIRLAWDWASPDEMAKQADAEHNSPVKVHAHDVVAPQTPGIRGPRMSGVAAAVASSARSSSPRSPVTPRSRVASPTVASPKVRGQQPVPPGLQSKLTHAFAGDSDESAQQQGGTTNTTSKFALGRRPRIVEILDITGTERGAFEAGRVRIVTSRRLSAKAGAERRVVVGTEQDGSDKMKLVALGGQWNKAGLQAAAKNPMSLALDHDKLVYGCADGSIVVAGFVTTSSSSSSSSSGSSKEQQ